jgi:ferredoxin
MSTACPNIIVINGTPVDVSDVPIHTSILDFLRTNGRTGSKVGCNEGDCGACTILVLENEGPPRAINGCLALVASLAGREIITAEGLARNGTSTPSRKPWSSATDPNAAIALPDSSAPWPRPTNASSPIPPPSPINSAATSAAAPAIARSAMQCSNP